MSSRGSSLCRSDTFHSEDEDISTNNMSESLSRSSSLSISSEDSTDSHSPPGYQAVLLENHLKRAKNHPGLYPPELVASISDFLFHRDQPAPDPYRTYHTLEKNFPDGSGYYNGELDHKSRRHGLGHIIYKNGDAYQGQWKKGLRESHGAYFWADTGSVYEGEWKAGERHGHGHFVFGSRRNECLSGVVFSGNWTKGKIAGKGLAALVNERGQVEKVPEMVNEENADGSEAKSGFVAKREFLQLFKRLSI